jgi:hypothetical protein
MKKIISLFALSFLLLTGCATTPTDDIKINAEADPKAKFSGYKTYAWLGSVGVLNDPDGKWKAPKFDLQAEVQFLIDRELRGRGMNESVKKPDMIVAYVMGVDMDALKLKEDPKTKKKLLTNAPKGGLLIVLTDAETGFVVWVGAAEADVHEGLEADIVKKRLDYAVSKMIDKLPK